MTPWRAVLVAVVVALVGGIALLRGAAMVAAFWAAFKYMEYSLWIKMPLAALLILTVAYLLWRSLRDEQIRGRRH